MNIDLSMFNNVDLNEEKFTSTYRMQNVNELEGSIDSLEIKMGDQKISYAENFSTKNNMFRLPETEDRILKDSIFIKAIELTIELQKNSALILRDSLDVGLNKANYFVENLLNYNIINKLDSNLEGSSKIKKILVTGHLGFIGFHVTKKFILLGYDVMGIDSLNSSISSLIEAKAPS